MSSSAVHGRAARASRAVACVFLAVLAAVAPARADELRQAVSKLQADYAASLDALAQWADAEGRADEAAATRAWLAPRDPDKLYVAALPEAVGPPPLPEGSPPSAAEWRRRFLALRAAQAEAYHELARRVVRRRASMAFELVLLAARENPDHAEVRRILGYEAYEGRWRTFWEARKLRSGWVDHPTFGWLPGEHVARYERGERFHNGRWVSAAEDARLRQSIERGWDVETEHYTVRTNHSLEAGVELGRRLETFLGVWRQLFIRYYATEAQVVGLFDGRARAQRAELPRFAVVYFRDRDDYNRSLRAALPNVEISIGVYLERMRRAYFFAGEQADPRTLYHEATHQLFHQSRPVAADVGRRANFWIVEGVALLMESFRREGDFHVIGGVDDVRFHAAQYRLLESGFFVPFEQVCALGMEQVQRDPRIATLYSQFTGMAYFLAFDGDGRHRDALVEYLHAVYSGRDDRLSLARLTGLGFDELDRQYREFIASAARRKGERGR